MTVRDIAKVGEMTVVDVKADLGALADYLEAVCSLSLVDEG
jgi:hypothetical protein